MINNTTIPQTGQIWMANLPKHSDTSSVQWGCRPVVLVGNEISCRTSPCVCVVPCTSKLRKSRLPTHVMLKDIPGLPRTSLALCEQITTLDKTNLVSCLGKIENPDIREKLLRAMKIQLAMI